MNGQEIPVFMAKTQGTRMPLILLLGETGESFDALTVFAEKEKLNCILCGIPVRDWNAQLSPWPGKAVFKNGTDFAGEADAFLIELLSVAELLKRETGCVRAALAGYSLAGLFALYAVCKTDVFDGIAAMSPSVWYEGFMEFLEAGEIRNRCMKAYLSLGRSEEKARNPVLRRVGDGIRQTRHLLSDRLKTEVPLIMHDGGHYFEVDARVQAGVKWLCENV